MNFSQVVKQQLKDMNMKASQLAVEIGHTPQHIHDLLKGNRNWNESTMKKACEVLGLKIQIVKASD
ncbi:helix-turn-helix transcriptional regulator [Paenibacillus larvae]